MAKVLICWHQSRLCNHAEDFNDAGRASRAERRTLLTSHNDIEVTILCYSGGKCDTWGWAAFPVRWADAWRNHRHGHTLFITLINLVLFAASGSARAFFQEVRLVWFIPPGFPSVEPQSPWTLPSDSWTGLIYSLCWCYKIRKPSYQKWRHASFLVNRWAAHRECFENIFRIIKVFSVLFMVQIQCEICCSSNIIPFPRMCLM